ncbi:MAG: hypothetical protein AB7F40_09825 [Victivallaceae bacterium]|nr:hypothetical protein [Victivallaceae bacterium]
MNSYRGILLPGTRHDEGDLAGNGMKKEKKICVMLKAQSAG